MDPNLPRPRHHLSGHPPCIREHPVVQPESPRLPLVPCLEVGRPGQELIGRRRIPRFARLKVIHHGIADRVVWRLTDEECPACRTGCNHQDRQQQSRDHGHAPRPGQCGHGPAKDQCDRKRDWSEQPGGHLDRLEDRIRLPYGHGPVELVGIEDDYHHTAEHHREDDWRREPRDRILLQVPPSEEGKSNNKKN